MTILWKGLGIGLVCCIISLFIKDREKDFSVILGIGACVVVSIMALSYLEPVLAFLRRLGSVGSLHSDHLSVLIKVVGIGLITDIAVQVCNDTGNSGTGKVMQFLGSAVMLWSAIPVFDALLDVICSVLGEI